MLQKIGGNGMRWSGVDLTEEQLKLAMLAGRYTETIEQRRKFIELGVSLALLYLQERLPEEIERHDWDREGIYGKVGGPLVYYDEVGLFLSTANIEAIMATAKLD